MTHLIETFLILGREKHQELNNVKFNLHDLVNDCFAKHDYLKQHAEIRCVNNIATSLEISCARQSLAIIIDNLVRNALQHTSEGEVSVLIDNNCILVRDTGDGIHEDNKCPANTSVLEKSGVGLNIVRRLSEKQGWQVHVESEVGEGTSVFIDISHSTTH